jgi:glyoxylase-like metal-dependent hydrolase (beta-lactamase superfamily II)
VITHMHYDHAGNLPLFAKARFHLQDKEMEYVTGRCMCHDLMRHPYEVEDVVHMVQCVYDQRVQFHDGAGQVAPGIEVHHIGGHTKGIQAVRVRTRRGWVVLASDASHFYAHMEGGRAFPILYSLADMLEGFNTLRSLATSPQHIVPGHDPLVMARYPVAGNSMDDWIVRLDAEPR